MKEFFLKVQIQAALLAALLAALGWGFRRWHSSRRPKLTETAKRLLEEIRADTRSSPKGITLFSVTGMGGFYEPFRWSPASGLEVNSVCRDIGEIRAAVEELVTARHIVSEEVHESYESYRLT